MARTAARTAARRGLVALGAAAALAACGSAGGSASAKPAASTSASAAAPALNGAEKMTAAQLGPVVQAAVVHASSVRIAGHTVDNGTSSQLDLSFQGTDVTGYVEQSGQRIDVVRVGGATYIRAPKAFYQQDNNAAAAELIGGRWVKATAAEAKDFQDITLASLGEQFFDKTSTGPVTRTTLAGAPAVTLKDSEGTTIWVADTGAIRPLQAEKSGTEGGLVTFTAYGSDFHIAAPAGAVDASTLS